MVEALLILQKTERQRGSNKKNPKQPNKKTQTEHALFTTIRFSKRWKENKVFGILDILTDFCQTAYMFIKSHLDSSVHNLLGK